VVQNFSNALKIGFIEMNQILKAFFIFVGNDKSTPLFRRKDCFITAHVLKFFTILRATSHFKTFCTLLKVNRKRYMDLCYVSGIISGYFTNVVF